jgi:hypothetical protein
MSQTWILEKYHPAIVDKIGLDTKGVSIYNGSARSDILSAARKYASRKYAAWPGVRQ